MESNASTQRLLTALPAVAQPEDYTYITNNGAITITKYIGPGGDVTIPATINGLPVTTIGDGGMLFGFVAFYACSNLTSVILPSSVTSIEAGEFRACPGLTNVIVPSSVTNIGCYAFISGPNLTAITVNVKNPAYSSLDGVLYNQNQTTVIQYPQGKSGSYSIPDGVTHIGDCAFYGCSQLEAITIPASVTSIGSAAFHACSKLSNATIGNNVSNIEKLAFSSCTNLTEVSFLGNAPSVGERVFERADKATIYYKPGTKGWGETFGGRPTKLWEPQKKDIEEVKER